MRNLPKSLATFERWLATHPVDGDRLYTGFAVRYQVARFCEYLYANPWPHGDPLRDADARDGVVNAYRAYLQTFDTPAATIHSILASLDHFFLFLGMGAARAEAADPEPALGVLDSSSSR